MNQNKLKCIQCMDKIKKGLDELGYSNIITNDKMNILCKAYIINLKNTTVTTTCPHANTVTTCPYTACKYPNSACHIHNTGNLGNSTNNSNSESSSKILESFRHESLFRIMPNDIDTGLFLHVIKLHGETCDLKMSFGYDDMATTEIINIIKFLVK